jgi:hypothetical protein
MWRTFFLARNRSRVMALALCAGVVLGGSLPEVGNLAQYYLFPNVRSDEDASHFFNGIFITIGVLGIIICGLALYRRLLQTAPGILVKKKETNDR